MAWLESHLELVTDGFEMVSLVFLVPHAFVRVDAMGLPALEFLAVGAGVLFGHVIVVLLFFFSCLPRDLDRLSLLRFRPLGLRSSSNDSLVKVAPYADSVYSKLVSPPSIIE